MTETRELQPLILDLVEWAAQAPRTYEQVMEAWRTSCPRLPVWETAVDEGFLKREWQDGEAAVVRVTDAGRRFLDDHGRGPGTQAVA